MRSHGQYGFEFLIPRSPPSNKKGHPHGVPFFVSRRRARIWFNPPVRQIALKQFGRRSKAKAPRRGHNAPKGAVINPSRTMRESTEAVISSSETQTPINPSLSAKQSVS
ncbi:MAG: hypothetical protein ACI9GB_002002 [Halioglobus sp.]|jgi:hypothetical protein